MSWLVVAHEGGRIPPRTALCPSMFIFHAPVLALGGGFALTVQRGPSAAAPLLER